MSGARRAALRVGRLAVCVFAVAVVGLGGVRAAGAHVTVTPTSAEAGQPATLAFRVPNEPGGVHAGHVVGAGSATIRFEIVLPSDHPIPGVTAEAPPGWGVQLRSDAGFVRSVVWTGGRLTGTSSERFRISTGPLPADAERLVFRAIQTYDAGVEVLWDDVVATGAPEPDNPAPVVLVTGGSAASPGTATAVTGADESSSTGTVVAVVVVGVVAAVALAIVGAVLITRRRSRSGPPPGADSSRG